MPLSRFFRDPVQYLVFAFSLALFPFLDLVMMGVLLAFYRFAYIRNIRYEVGPEIIRVCRRLFFKRIDQVELFRVKDYVLTQPFTYTFSNRKQSRFE